MNDLPYNPEPVKKLLKALHFGVLLLGSESLACQIIKRDIYLALGPAKRMIYENVSNKARIRSLYGVYSPYHTAEDTGTIFMQL